MDVKECYRVLELEIGASRETVEAAYFRQMERWRPDRVAASGGGLEAVQEANRMVERINEAYRTLEKIVPATAPAGVSAPPMSSSKLKVVPLVEQVAAARRLTLPPFSPPPPPASAPPLAPAPIAAAAPAAAAPPARTKPAPPPGASNASVALAPKKFAVLPPKRRQALIIAATAVLILLVLAAGKFASFGERRSAGPDPLTTSRLVVKSNRPDATIEATRLPAAGEKASATLHGSAEGAAEQAMPGLPPGKYTLLTRSTGWPDITQEVSLTAGQTTEVVVNFKVGSLRLDSVPTGAMVRQGEVVLGRTPLVVPQLPPGECQLSIEYPAWPPLSFKTTIAEGRETAETARLPHGRLVVESSPAGATVLFAGRPIGQTPLTVERFQAGTKKLTVQAKDFPPMEISVAMEDHGEAKVSVSLSDAFPVLDPVALLSAVWRETAPEDKDRLSPVFSQTINFKPKNGIVRNLDRKKLFENWLDRKFRYTGTIRSYNRESGKIEFVDQSSENIRGRVLAQLSIATRSDKDLVARLTKGATFSVYGRLDSVEEPSWPAKVITLELSPAELQR